MEATDVPSHTVSKMSTVNITTAHSSENSAIHSQSRVHLGGGSQKGIFFLISRRVTVAYGPYMNLGVLDYRTERLDGLMKALKKIGGEPVLKPSYHVNRVRVWHLEHEIFSCRITDLQHGGDGDLDKYCIDAARALDKSSRRAHFNMKTRYRLQMHLNESCPCHPPVPESHRHLSGHHHSNHGDHTHSDVSTRASYIGSSDSNLYESIHSSGHHGHHGHGHHHDHGHGHHLHGHAHHHGEHHHGEHHHHHHHHQHGSHSNSNEDLLGGFVGGEPRPSQAGPLKFA